MYQPLIPCGANDSRWYGVLWTCTLVPGGASGIQLKLNGPNRAAHTDSFG